MTNHKPVLQLYMPNAGEAGVVYAWVAGSPDVKEFKGTPLSRWTRTETSDFQKILSALNSMHRDDLMLSNIVTILGNQRDHSAVLRLMDGPVGSVPVNYGHPRVRHRIAPKIRPTRQAVKTVPFRAREIPGLTVGAKTTPVRKVTVHVRRAEARA